MTKGPTRIVRDPTLRWILIADLHIRPSAQRSLQPKWVEDHRAKFDPDEIGHPVVNHAADGRYYIIDGQHRIELLRAIGWGDQQVQCECYDGLSVEEEADKFLKLNDRLNIKTFSKFKVRRTSGDPIAVGIGAVLAECGLLLEEQRRDGCVRAVAALERVYRGCKLGPAAEKDGPGALRRTLQALKGAWGDGSASFDGALIEGMGLVQLTYNGRIDQKAMAQKLAGVGGGGPSILGNARSLRTSLGGSTAHCIAGVIVQAYNRGRRTDKLADWWKG